MDEYILHGASSATLFATIADSLTGPEEFARLVDEIPADFRDPDAHLFRPDLFTNAGGPDQGTDPNGIVKYSTFGSRLAFLARYRDMHSAYADGDRAGAADLLIQLLANELAPRGWWAVLLVDACPLLEGESALQPESGMSLTARPADEEVLISSSDTWELLRCLEAIVAPILAQPDRRDLRGNLDYLKRIVRPPTGGAPDRRSDRDETEAALKQLQVVRHALARNLSRCLAGAL